MPKRTAKSASAAFVIILAGIPLATITHGETAPSDGCLSAPKAETPSGSHWRYRIDHANKRNCWYLRSENGQSQAAPQNASPAPSAKPSVADAHAELRAQAGREDGPTVSLPATASPPANAPRSAPWPANPSTGAASSAGAAPAPGATRWQNPAAASPVPSSGESGATANSADNPPQASASLATAVAASTPADAPTPARPATVPPLIAAAIAAIALAGAAAALISRRNRVRLPRHRKMSRARAPIWETTDDDRIVLEDQPPWDRDYQPRFARSVGSAKVQPPKMQPAKVQTARVQTGKAQAANDRGDRRTEFPPRMPRSASR